MAASLPTPPPVKRRVASKRPKALSFGRRKSRAGKNNPQASLLLGFLLIGLEYLGLMSIGVAAIIVLLGYSANRFSGTGFFKSHLPFISGIIGFIILAVILLGFWQRLRRKLRGRSPLLPPVIVLGLALVIANDARCSNGASKAIGSHVIAIRSRERPATCEPRRLPSPSHPWSRK